MRCRDLWQSREALQKYILAKVNEAYDVLMTRHIKTYHYYIHIATRETSAPPEVVSHALGTAIFARDLLLEGTMARRYFTYMLHDLKKSEDAQDMYAMNVPSVPANLLALDHQECEANHRTYQSGGSHFIIYASGQPLTILLSIPRPFTLNARTCTCLSTGFTYRYFR